MVQHRRALIVAGPTCSGKSALALDLAERLGGTVINADSMQIYRELRIVTARPSLAEEARVPHRLYGVRPAASPGSMAWWRQEALRDMAESPGMPILCGGTGLYLSALVNGIADIPEPDPAIREEARALLAEQGAAALHARLAEADPITAARLRPSDSQRIARAWEVWRSTGRSLAAWQASAHAPAAWEFRTIVLDPPREALYARCDARLAAMLDQDMLGEVSALMARNLDPALPLMKAVGFREFAAHLRGETSLAQALAAAQQQTRNYAKRQTTWARGQMADWPRIREIDAEAQWRQFLAVDPALTP